MEKYTKKEMERIIAIEIPVWNHFINNYELINKANTSLMRTIKESEYDLHAKLVKQIYEINEFGGKNKVNNFISFIEESLNYSFNHVEKVSELFFKEWDKFSEDEVKSLVDYFCSGIENIENEDYQEECQDLTNDFMKINEINGRLFIVKTLEEYAEFKSIKNMTLTFSEYMDSKDKFTKEDIEIWYNMFKKEYIKIRYESLGYMRPRVNTVDDMHLNELNLSLIYQFNDERGKKAVVKVFEDMEKEYNMSTTYRKNIPFILS